VRGAGLVLAIPLAVCLLTGQAAASGEPTNTPVPNGQPTWTAVVWPTSSAPTNTPLPPYTATPKPTATIGEPISWPPPVLWLPMISKGE